MMYTARGRRIAVLALVIAGCGGGDGGTAVTRSPVASVVVTPGSASLAQNEIVSLAASVRDASGHELAGREVRWSVRDATVAGVDGAGRVTGIAPGETSVTATSEGVSGSATVTVTAPLGAQNFTLVSAHLTQAVQRMNGSVPLIAGGNPALVNVYITSSRPLAPREIVPEVRVRLVDGTRIVAEDQRAATGTIGATVVEGRPSHQVIFPASALAPGVALSVELDPGGQVAQTRRDDDRFPAIGTQPLDVRTLPAFDVHFIPIFLNSGQTLGNVTAGNVPQYLIALRQMHPVAGVTTSIGTSMATDIPFASGDPTAWQQILRELDTRRVIEGSASYWFGAIKPPAGVTFVTNGGWAYIPQDPASSGPATRTALGVNVGWFTNPNKATELFAHEMGHTLGRFHAPCGSPAGPDPRYPYAGGLTGVGGYDLSAAQPGGAIPPYHDPSTTGDLMGYCSGPWVSDYTYEGILAFREAGVVAAAMARVAPAPATCVIVSGRVAADGATLDPVQVALARPAMPASGPYVAEGVARDGRVIFRVAFAPTRVDHARDVSQFALAIPLADDDRRALARVRVMGAGVAVESHSTGANTTALAMRAPGADAFTSGDAPAATRLDARRVRITWDATRWPSVIVRDRETGEVIGFGRSGALVILSSKSRFDVSVSDGVQAEMTTVAVNGR